MAWGWIRDVEKNKNASAVIEFSDVPTTEIRMKNIGINATRPVPIAGISKSSRKARVR
jgi:hypothetical protein